MGTVIDAYHARRAETIQRDTWGHLDAKPGVKYPGSLVFGEDAYGSLFILRVDFGEHAGEGPWFYEGIQSWLYEQDLEAGELYRFDGWYRLCKNGRHQFVGRTRRIAVGA